jgi:hypothetical protein
MNKPICDKPKDLCHQSKRCLGSCLKSDLKSSHSATCPQCKKEVSMSEMESKSGGGPFVCPTCRGN